MDLPNTKEFLNKIIEVGIRGFCTSAELDYFLPEILKLRKIKVVDADLPDLIRGYHLVEMGYRVKCGNNIGFGSPSKTFDLIWQLEKANKGQAGKLYNWVAATGGNYYIRPNISYEKLQENLALAEKKRADVLVNDRKVHLEAIAKRKQESDAHKVKSDDTHKIYQEYLATFGKMTDDELVKAFNKEVGNLGWVRRRGIFMAALHTEFESRSFDYSAVGGKGGLVFRKQIKLEGKKVVLK